MTRDIVSREGVKMPAIIYGTAWKKERTEALVVEAVKAGFAGIDTACQPKHYAEPLVGSALKALEAEGIARESLFVQTKFTPLEGQDPQRVPYDPAAPPAEQVAQSFAASRRNLQTEYVDSLLLHSPLFPFSKLMEVWRAMETVRKSGGAMQLGISNCYDPAVLARLFEEAECKPAVVQNRFYFDSGYDVALRRFCDANDIIYQSFWTLTANPHILASPLLREIARRHGKSEAQIFFGYLGSCGIIPLTGTTSPEHMREDLASFDIALTAADRDAIKALLD